MKIPKTYPVQPLRFRIHRGYTATGRNRWTYYDRLSYATFTANALASGSNGTFVALESVPAAKTVATCGDCGRSWDDAKSTSITPVPSGRCPFEAFHSGAAK